MYDIPQRTCVHGCILGKTHLIGSWMGGVSTCQCCLGSFGWIDDGHWSTTTSGGRTWTPKTLCSACGGEYQTWGNSQ